MPVDDSLHCVFEICLIIDYEYSVWNSTNIRLLYRRYCQQGIFYHYKIRYIFILCKKIQILRIHFILTILSFLGVIVIVLGGSGKSNLNSEVIGYSHSILVYLLPLGAAFTSACSMSYLHKMKDKVHPLLTVEYLMIGAIMTSGFLFNFEKS